MTTAFDGIIGILQDARRRGDLDNGDLAERMAEALTAAGIESYANVEQDDGWPPVMIDVLTRDDVAIVFYPKKPNKYKVAAIIRKYFKRVSGGVLLVVPGAQVAPLPLEGFDGPCAVVGI